MANQQHNPNDRMSGSQSQADENRTGDRQQQGGDKGQQGQANDWASRRSRTRSPVQLRIKATSAVKDFKTKMR